MGFNIGKYEFNSEEQFEDKFAALHTEDSEGNLIPDFRFEVIKLGYQVVQEATYDDEGKVITPAVFGNKYHVDAFWRDLEDHPYGWKTYSVDIETEGLHGFVGLSYLKHKF